MPAKNSQLTTGERYNPLTKKLWKAFCKDTGIPIDYLTFRDIVWETNSLIAEGISECDAGVELPEQLGNIVVNKYKSKKVPTDWVNSKRLKRKIPLLNLHSFGYLHHIRWFKMGMRTTNKTIYKFKAYRTLSRKVASNIKTGKIYHHYENSDFWATTKMERTYNKIYKRDL